jgi:hypothetical protein
MVAGVDRARPEASCQERALAHIAARAEGPPIEAGLRVTLNFHPDRLHDRVPILVALGRDGVYRSQFETGTSNGGLGAHPGGIRWNFESRIFGGAYDRAAPGDRPKYGALNHRRRAVGGSPRFGSAHLRLTESVLDRTTFCYPDSVYEPLHFGTAARMGLGALADAHEGDPLDDYIEAQVHGPLVLSEHVEALVLDPCFAGTDVEGAARLLPCPIEWHAGFRLRVADLRRHPEFRGPRYVELGAALARHGALDAAMIGEAARTGEHDPQDLKRVWHYVAWFGAPDRRRH